MGSEARPKGSAEGSGWPLRSPWNRGRVVVFQALEGSEATEGWSTQALGLVPDVARAETLAEGLEGTA